MHTQVLYSESKLLAEEFYALMQTLDPSRWRSELESAIRERLELLASRARALVEAAERIELDEQKARLTARLRAVMGLIREQIPRPDLPTAEQRQEWRSFWRNAQPVYEALAASLTLEDIHVPQLRPTNYARNIFHVGSGLIALLMLQYVLTPTTTIYLAGFFASFAWTCEAFRRNSPRVNTILMRFFGRMAHPHEYYRVNSGTWYSTALLLISLFANPLACSLAVVVLAVGDPAAAVIGRRFGRIRLINGRSLEGSLAFVATGVLASMATMILYYPQLAVGVALVIALAASAPAAIAELISKRVDDNFSIPVVSAAGASLAMLPLAIF